MEINQGYSYHINAFLIQDAFPIIKNISTITIEQKPVIIHSKLNRNLTVNLRKAPAMHKQGIHLIFPDIEYIKKEMEKELSE